eukprot:3758003-Amphidinium_carterae.1
MSEIVTVSCSRCMVLCASSTVASCANSASYMGFAIVLHSAGCLTLVSKQPWSSVHIAHCEGLWQSFSVRTCGHDLCSVWPSLAEPSALCHMKTSNEEQFCFQMYVCVFCTESSGTEERLFTSERLRTYEDNPYTLSV